VKKLQQKILDTSRKLFNQNGLSAVTARAICADLKISPGSFSYHYPEKSQLIIELYRGMINEMNSCFSDIQHHEISISQFLQIFQKCAFVQLKYKFFFLNLTEILISFPTIKQAHKKAIVRERLLAQEIFQQFIASGIVDKASKKEDLKNMLRQTQILFAYWPLDAQLRGFNTEKDAVWYYTEVCCSPILPFLNKESKQEFESFIKKQKHE